LGYFKVILLLFFPLIVLNTRAQQPHIFLAEPLDNEKKELDWSFVGCTPSKTIILNRVTGKSNSLGIKLFENDSLTLLNSKTIDLQADDEDLDPEMVFNIGDQLYLMGSLRNKSKGNRTLYGGVFSLKAEQVQAFRPICAMPEGRLKNKQSFGMELAMDSSLLFSHYQLEPEKGEGIRFELNVFDPQLNLIHSKRLALPYPEETMEISEWLIDRDTNIWFLTGISPQKNISGLTDLERSNRRYVLFSYSFKENRLKEFDVNLKDKWVMALTFEEMENDEICIGGFYSKDPAFSISGTFFLRIGISDKEVISTGMMAFDKGFVRDNARNGNFDKELSNYYFDQFIPSRDDGAWFLAEQYYVTEQFLMDGNTGRTNTSYTYHYNDILVVKVNKGGEIQFARRIPKAQFSVNDGGPYLSYALSSTDSGISIVFYDHLENTKLSSNQKPRSMSNLKKAVLNHVEVNEDGLVTRTLLKGLDKKNLIRPKQAYEVGKGELVFLNENRKSRQIIRMSFE